MDAKGEPVVTLTPGRYHLIVHDLSSEHNFVMADEPAGASSSSGPTFRSSATPPSTST
jgi:hypothetical protein